MRTLGQQRADYALQRILKYYSNLGSQQKKEFKSFVAGIPAMIQQNGFGQALAFCLAKSSGSDKYSVIFSIAVEWLSFNKSDVHNSFARETDQDAFMRELSQMDQRDYLVAQKETMALLEWVKRFAAAYAD